MGRQPLPLAPDLTRYSDFARGMWRWIAAYAANPDPRVASCNTIALLVASNQPFYPLYVYFCGEPAYRANPADVSFDPVFPRDPCGLATVSGFRSCASAANRSRQCGRERESIWRSFRGGDLHRPVRVDRGGFFPPLGKGLCIRAARPGSGDLSWNGQLRVRPGPRLFADRICCLCSTERFERRRSRGASGTDTLRFGEGLNVLISLSRPQRAAKRPADSGNCCQERAP